MKQTELETKKQQIRVSFEQILERCQTVGDLQELHIKVMKMRSEGFQ